MHRILCHLVVLMVCIAVLATAQDQDRAPIYKEIKNRHDEAVRRLQDWIRQPSIAAEKLGMNEVAS